MEEPFFTRCHFCQTTTREIADVEADWATRDLSPKGVKEEYKSTVNFVYWTAKVRVVSYLVHGSRNYGAIIVPVNATPGCLSRDHQKP